MAQMARGRSQRGAAAIEFALVVPMLLTLLFGVVDYGLWLNDSLNVRQGIREGARQGVVKRFDRPGCTGTDVQKFVCKTRAEIASVVGPAYVRIVIPAAGWKRGESLLVCGMVKSSGLSGMVPLPADGLIKSSTSMSIESDTPVPTGGATPGAVLGDAAPSGASWSWCV